MTIAQRYGNVKYALRLNNIETNESVGSQWRLTNHRLCLFLERCFMGVVHQIKDLDNSSKPLPYNKH